MTQLKKVETRKNSGTSDSCMGSGSCDFPGADIKIEYGLLAKQVAALVEDVPYLIANLANVCAFLNQEMQGINWIGFYLLEAGKLVLGPFQGKPACIEIPPGAGVCGTAAARDESVLVRDVLEFPGHIACDAASRSEVVVPIHRQGRVVAVLDIDSPFVGRFTEEDRQGLKKIADVLDAMMEKHRMTDRMPGY